MNFFNTEVRKHPVLINDRVQTVEQLKESSRYIDNFLQASKDSPVYMTKCTYIIMTT